MTKNNILLILAISLFSLWSCDKENEKVYLDSDPKSPEILAPSAANGLSFTKPDAESLKVFIWSAADFGFQASVTYGVEISKTSDFAAAATLLTTQNDTGTVKVKDINSVLLSWELEIGAEATIYCRAFATISNSVEKVYSVVKTYTVTPYETLVDYPMVYVPGEYQGWSPGAENGRLYAYDFGSVYKGIIRFTDSDGNGSVEFKITSNPDWDHTNWGGTLTSGSGTLSTSGSNITVTPGTYSVEVNTSTLSITVTSTDDWGIIGSAIPPFDWSADMDMVYNGQRKMWEITADLHAGAYKFRANNGWDKNLGDTGANGSLEAGGTDISLAEAGNYTIRLDVENSTYSVIKN